MQLRHLDNGKNIRFTIVVCYQGTKFCYYKASKHRKLTSILQYFTAKQDFTYLSIFTIDSLGRRIKRVYYISNNNNISSNYRLSSMLVLDNGSNQQTILKK